MKPVRCGVWGVGVWGEKHARVYGAVPEAELVGVYDRSADRARGIAAQYGTREALDRCFKILFREKRTVAEAVERMRERFPAVHEVEVLARFAETSARGLSR